MEPRWILRSAAIAPERIISDRPRRNQGAVALGAVGELADIAFEAKLAARKQTQRLRVDAMLDAEDTLRQRLRRVAVGHRDRALHHDRAGVGFGAIFFSQPIARNIKISCM